jgi:hypothetical protein
MANDEVILTASRSEPTARKTWETPRIEDAAVKKRTGRQVIPSQLEILLIP